MAQYTVRKTTKLIEGGHRGFQDYRHTSTFFYVFYVFWKSKKSWLFTFFAVFRTFSRTMILSAKSRLSHWSLGVGKNALYRAVVLRQRG